MSRDYRYKQPLPQPPCALQKMALAAKTGFQRHFMSFYRCEPLIFAAPVD